MITSLNWKAKPDILLLEEFNKTIISTDNIYFIIKMHPQPDKLLDCVSAKELLEALNTLNNIT